jgi:hypothetical protein
MNLTPIRANMTELVLNGGLTVLFSYITPVACVWTNGTGSRTLMRTEKHWSNTTSRHINLWASGWTLSEAVVPMPQQYFDNLIAGVK